MLSRSKTSVRILVLILALATVVAFTPLTPKAYATDPELYVGGVAVTASGSVTGTNITAGTVTYDASTRTLTLTNATITGSASEPDEADCAAIYSAGSLNIVLYGSNNITGANSSAAASYDATGINVNANGEEDTGVLSISGSGSMLVRAGTSVSSSGNGSVGIFSEGPINVSGSVVVMAYGNTSTQWRSWGIKSGSNITVSDSVQLTGTAGSGFMESVGISAETGISGTGTSRITADGGESSNGIGLRVIAGNTISANGGNFLVKGKDKAFYKSVDMFQTAVTLGTGEVATTNTAYNATGTNADYTSGTANDTGVKYFEAEPERYSLHVAGIEVNAKNKDSITGTGISGSVTYNSSTNTLTLNNAAITSGAGISYSGSAPFYIILTGTNSIINDGSGTGMYLGVYPSVINGTGSLTITTPGIAITAGDLTIKGVTIVATGKKGILVKGPVGLVIDGGNVTANKTANDNDSSMGIDTTSLLMKKGVLNATGDIGIKASKSITISGGDVTATGTTALPVNIDSSSPSLNNLTITAGTLTASGRLGIQAVGTTYIKGGSVKIKTGDFGLNSDLEMSGGTIIIEGTGSSKSPAIIGTIDLSGYTDPYIYAGDASSSYQKVTVAELKANYHDYKYLRIQPQAESTNPSISILPPAITTQPKDAGYNINDAAAALIVATSDAGAKFQWQQSADGTTWTNIDGATAASYTPAANASGTTYYRCVITGSIGLTAMSDTAKITVSEKYAIPQPGTERTIKGFKYRITVSPADADSYGEVRLVMETTKHRLGVIPSVITIDGYKFKVKIVSANAFSGNDRITSLTVGKYVRAINRSAFSKCSKLATIRFAGKNLTYIGKNAFSTCAQGCKFKIPASKFKAYKKLLLASGLPKGAEIVKVY